MTSVPYSSCAVTDYSVYADKFKSMQTALDNGNVDEFQKLLSETTQSVMDTSSANGKDVSQEDVMAILNEQYTYLSGGISLDDDLEDCYTQLNSTVNADGSTTTSNGQTNVTNSNTGTNGNTSTDGSVSGNTITGGTSNNTTTDGSVSGNTITGGTSNNTTTNGTTSNTTTTNSTTNSNYKITDFTFLANDLQIMHGRLMGNNEKEALDMRKSMAAEIMQMYADNGSSITEKKALALVDQQYKCMSGGASIIDSIQATTKDADSFWNHVPIVNLFIDDTSAEDLYDYMEGKDPDTKTAEDKGKKTLAATTSGVATGAAIGAGLGLCGGPFAPITVAGGAAVGAIVGGVAGFFSGLFD